MRNQDFILEAKKHNITEIGFISAKPYNHLFEKEYKSIVVALFPYFCGYPEESNISLYTRGIDYHIVVKDIFDDIFDRLSVSDYEIYSDVGPEIDTKLAYESGLGIKGINGLIINKKYGSYVFIGYALCNEEFEYSLPSYNSCIGCKKCVNACPGNAISDDGRVDVRKCLSNITQTKGDLTNNQRDDIVDSGVIFGCDICQKVCPHNKDISMTEIRGFNDKLIDNLYLEDIKNLSNKEFKNIFGNRAFSWRGKALLERNLKYFGDRYEHNKTES